MKRVLTFILIIQLLIVSVYAADNSSAAISASTVSGSAGETVEITISISSNPGYTNYAILLDYNREALTLQAITPVETEDGPLYSTNCDYRAVDAKSYGFVTAAEETEQTEDGTLFTASFLIAENFSGEAHVTPIVQYLLSNEADFGIFAQRIVQVEAGCITVESSAESILFGDANGDGKINAADAAIVYRYVNNKLTENQLATVNPAAMDVSGDSKINAADAAMIYRYANNKLAAFPAASNGGT